MSPEEINQILAFETRKQRAKLWGEEITFSPYLCKEKLGDGMQLVWLITCGQRPYWWLIRIDSKTDLNADDFNIEEILEPIEEEVGSFEEDDPHKWGNGTRRWKYPEICWDGGNCGIVINFATTTFEDWIIKNSKEWEEYQIEKN